VPENKAMVIYGWQTRPGSEHKGYKIITKDGGSGPPIITLSEMMDIGPQNIELDQRDVKILSDGVDRKASMRATAIVRFLKDEVGLHAAVEHLLHVNHSDVGKMARTFTEAKIRLKLRKMEIQEATSDLMKTAQNIQEKVRMDLRSIGVTVDNLKIHELKLRGD